MCGGTNRIQRAVVVSRALMSSFRSNIEPAHYVHPCSAGESHEHASCASRKHGRETCNCGSNSFKKTIFNILPIRTRCFEPPHTPTLSGKAAPGRPERGRVASSVASKRAVDVVQPKKYLIFEPALTTDDPPVKTRALGPTPGSMDEYASSSTERKRVPLLPPQSKEDEGKVCVVLDMDETLLHSEFGEHCSNLRQREDRPTVTSKEDFRLRVLYHGSIETIRVYTRPGLRTFLRKAAEHFEVVVFTAALPVYANAALDRIDPEGYIRHRLFRDACVDARGLRFVKDVSILGRDMSRIVLVDNSPVAMAASPGNSIPILSFFDSKHDRELPKLLKTLYDIKVHGDAQACLRDQFPGFSKQINDFVEDLHRQWAEEDAAMELIGEAADSDGTDISATDEDVDPSPRGAGRTAQGKQRDQAARGGAAANNDIADG